MNKLVFAFSIVAAIGVASAADAFQDAEGQMDSECGISLVDIDGDGEITLD